MALSIGARGRRAGGGVGSQHYGGKQLDMPEWSPQVGHKFLLGQLWELGGSQCEPAIASIPFGAGLRLHLRRRPLYADQPPPGSPITSVAARPSSSFHPSSSPTPLHSFACALSKRGHPPFNASPFSNASFVLHISPYAFLYINNNFSELASRQHEVIFIFNQLDSTATSFKTKI